MALPNRKMNGLDGIWEVFQESMDVFVDGTERPIQRPKNSEKQKKNYSGMRRIAASYTHS